MSSIEMTLILMVFYLILIAWVGALAIYMGIDIQKRKFNLTNEQISLYFEKIPLIFHIVYFILTIRLQSLKKDHKSPDTFDYVIGFLAVIICSFPALSVIYALLLSFIKAHDLIYLLAALFLSGLTIFLAWKAFDLIRGLGNSIPLSDEQKL